MLDLKLLRENPDAFRDQLAKRGADRLLDDLLAADERRRELIHKVETKQAKKNEVSKQVGQASPEEREKLLEEARGLTAEIDAMEPQLSEAEEHVEMLASGLPNLPHPDVPAGESDEDNVELRTWGSPPELAEPLDHLDLGRLHGIIDTERASRAAGTRFGYLLGEVAQLEFALVRFAWDRLLPHGFVPMVPPVLVRREVMFGAGDLPADEAQYYVVQDGSYLTGTSEQAIAAFHMGEDVAPDDLPLRYTAFSSCFRREAGTYGRDTRGIFRVHQFDKVEMFSFTDPDRSWEEFDFLVALEEELLQALGLPYRAMDVCTGELGAKAARKIDLEVWFPGQERYREVTSCSNCTDYQTRRLNIRMPTEGGRAFVHTLNGTAVTNSRTIAAILENFQEPGGEVAIPEVLHPYLPQGLTRIPARP